MELLVSAINRMAKVNLGLLPTTIHRLKNIERDLEFPNIYIKRDDMTGLGPGGNKVRSLEFILGQAIEQNSDLVIVYGPLQSNLCTLTACACAKLGLKCLSIHNSETPHNYNGNLLLNRLLNVESVFLGNISSAERNNYAEELADKLKREGQKPYIVANGGTTGVGALGYVAACVEMMEQIKEKNIPVKTIFVPGGNGGVAAGLIYGNVLLGRPFDIVVISVEYETARLADNISATIAEIEELLGLPFNDTLENSCLLVDDYRGEGWGANTAASENFVHRLPQMEGIFIENIYTSKVLVGLEDFIGKGLVKSGVCYLHTGGLGSLFSQY